MNINIYAEYEIKISHKWITKVDYDEFKEYETELTIRENGGAVLNGFGNVLKRDWLSSIDIDKEKQIVKVEIFNPITGEGETDVYEIKEIEREKNK